MFDAPILKLLEGKLPTLPTVVVESSLARDIDDLLAGILPRAQWAVIDDRNTRDALGERVFKAVQKNGGRHITFDASPPADDTAVAYVRQRTRDCDALLAVGGGTINDICKYAAVLDNKPYVVFPTAASMNGYLSANASISVQGYKKTCAAQMPLAVFCDMSVIAAAPPRLSKSGLGDSLARPTAQADWLLSHFLLNTPYDETPFMLLAPYEPQLFDNARGVAGNDKETIALLMKTLLLSGLGMTIAKGSYPASEAEHMIAHAMGMLPGAKRNTLHGEEIGVTTLAMATLQEQLLRGKPKLRTDNFPEQKIKTMFGNQVTQEAKKAFAVKRELVRSGRGWQLDMVEKIEKIVLSPSRLQTILGQAEAPTAIEALGWNKKDYAEVATVARFLRERFTFLDLE